MKRTMAILGVAAAMVLGAATWSGCGTTAQQSAYQAVGTLGVTAAAAMQGWADWAKSGKATDSQILTVEKAYRAYVNAYNVMVDAGKATVGSQNTAALQTAVQVVAACEADVVSLVMQFLPPDVAAKLKS